MYTNHSEKEIQIDVKIKLNPLGLVLLERWHLHQCYL